MVENAGIIIPKDVQKNVIGSTTLNLTNIDLRESDKNNPFNELLKKNTLFRYMVLFLFSNSPIKSNSINESRQLLYLILQIDKRDIELYLKQRKEKGDEMAYTNRLQYIENANELFTNQKYNDFKKKFYDIISTVNLNDLFDDILDVEDIDKNTFSSVFTNQEFTEFKNKLNTINGGDLQIQNLNEIKLRNELIGEKGIVGTNVPKKVIEDEEDNIKNLDEYLSPKEYEQLSEKMKEKYEDSEVDNHLNLIAKFEDSKPILYDNIMDYIEIKKHFIKEKDEEIVAAQKEAKNPRYKVTEDKTSFRIEFDQYTYLKNIFKKFGFEDIEDTNFELHSSILKNELPKEVVISSGKRKLEGGEDMLMENIKGSLTKDKNYLAYLAPVYENNEFTKIKLIGTKNIQEYDIDNSSELNSLQTELNQLDDNITLANLKDEIEKVLLKNLSSDLPFATSLLSIISPSGGKINLGKFTMVITFDDVIGNNKDIDDLVTKVSQLTQVEGSDTKKKGKKLLGSYEKFRAFFTKLENDKTFDSKKYGKSKKPNIIFKPEELSDGAQTEAMKEILTVIITTLEKNLMGLKDNEEQKKKYIEEKIKQLKDGKKKKKLSSEFLSEPNFKAIDLQYFDEITPASLELEPIEINTQNIIEDIFAKNTKRYQDDMRTVSREDAVEMFIKQLEEIQKKMKNPNIKLGQFILDLKALKKLLKTKDDGRIGQKQEAYEVPEKQRLLPNVSETGLTSNITYDMLDAYIQLKDSNINEKDYFELFAEESKRVKTSKSFIPIVTEKEYNFDKKGSVNVRRYKIKWKSTKELTSKKKKETAGKFSDIIPDAKGKPKEKNVKLGRMIDTILRNFKTLQGLTR